MQNGTATLRRWAAALIVAGHVWPGAGADVPAAEPAADNGAVVVMYHRFGEDGYAATNIGLDQFDSHIEELTSGRYNVLPLPEIVTALAGGRKLPDRSVGITIDDAFLSVYTQAWPRLRKAGLPFTLFVATEPVDRNYPGYMNWYQLREMLAGGGVTIAAHGVTHRSMFGQAKDHYAKILTEIEDSPVQLHLADVKGGRTTDRYALPRFPLNEAYGDLERFRLVANSLAIPTVDVTPIDPLLSAANNPPPYGFTVLEGFGSLKRIACYAIGQTLSIEQLGSRRVEVRLSEAFKPGPEGRWRWLGRQFYVPGG